MEEKLELTMYKTNALGIRAWNHVYVVGEGNGQTRRYGCFGVCNGGEEVMNQGHVMHVLDNSRNRIAAHVCFNPWDPKDEYTSMLWDTCGILYLVTGVCHQMANRIMNNQTDFGDPMEVTCNADVGGGWASLIYGHTGLFYDDYKLLALFAYYKWKDRDHRENISGDAVDPGRAADEAEKILERLLKSETPGSKVVEDYKGKLLELILSVCEKEEALKKGAFFEVYKQFLLSIPEEKLIEEEQGKLHDRIAALQISEKEKGALEKVLDDLLEKLVKLSLQVYEEKDLSEETLNDYSEQARKKIGEALTKSRDNVSGNTFEIAFGLPYEKLGDLTGNAPAKENTDSGDGKGNSGDGKGAPGGGKGNPGEGKGAPKDGKETNDPGDEKEGDTPEPSLIEQIYEAIKEVIGGTNENQFFCMMSPGTTLNESDFKYDTKGLKPASVSANESRLVNKLFDACHVTGSDNGRSLPTQFLSALNVLTPKLNPELAKAKNALRAMLMTKIKYEFEEGTVESTFQQVFYRLYEDWVKEKQKWAKAQDEKKAELESRYGGDTEEQKQQIENKYIEWYQIEAEAALLAIEAKLGKILGLFSLDDMQVIEGVLNSSVGSELYEAKSSVLNAKRYNPDGGSTYPVTLTPSDWPKFLNSNFNAVDLLDTPDAKLQEYRTLTSRRLSLANQIARFQDLDQSSEIGKKINELSSAKKEYDNTASELSAGYAEGTLSLIQTIAGFASGDLNLDAFIFDMPCEKINESSKEELTDDTPDEKTKKRISADALKDMLTRSLDQQTAFVNAAQSVADIGRELIADKTSNLSEMLKPLLAQLDDVNSRLKELETEIKHSVAIAKEPTELTAQAVENEFMEVLIHTDASTTQSSGSMSSNSSASSCGASFWFGGYSQSKSSSSAAFQNFSASKSTKIDIGFYVTKVDIGRAWFNPGVFMLSNSMFNLSGKRISYNPAEHEGEISENKIFESMNDSLFSCFPVAFVIAKDVTIRLTNEESVSSTVRSAMQEQVSRGGGIFCFRGSSASSSSSESNSSKVQNTSKGVTIKFPGPQILGYYLEKTPADESRFLTTGSTEQDISIEDFVTSCKQMIDAVYHS